MTETTRVLVEYVRDQLAPHDQIEASTNLLEEDIVDSIGILSLVQFIEEHFDIVVEADDVNLENFATIASMSRYIDRLRG